MSLMREVVPNFDMLCSSLNHIILHFLLQLDCPHDLVAIGSNQDICGGSKEVKVFFSRKP